MNSFKKILILVILLICLITPAMAVEIENNEEILIHQRLKNVTRKDHPAGSTTTIGFPGDRVHYLITVQNPKSEAQDITIKSILPYEINYLPFSAKLFQEGQTDWKDINPNKNFPLSKYKVHLEADGWIAFTFRSDIIKLPKSNVSLTNIVKVEDEDGKILAQSATRVLAPNSNLKKIVNENSETELTAYEQELLNEEFIFIEKIWNEIQQDQNDEEIPEEIKKDNNQNNYITIALALTSFLLFTFIFYRFTKKKVK